MRPSGSCAISLYAEGPRVTVRSGRHVLPLSEDLRTHRLLLVLAFALLRSTSSPFGVRTVSRLPWQTGSVRSCLSTVSEKVQPPSPE